MNKINAKSMQIDDTHYKFNQKLAELNSQASQAYATINATN